MHFLFFCVFIFFASAQLPSAHLKRVIVHSANTTAPPVGLADVQDKDHAAMLAFNAPNNVFTQADDDKLDRDADAFFLEWYGQNWTAGNLNVIPGPFPGTRILLDGGLPLALRLSFKEEHNFTIKVLVDTAHILRGTIVEPDWCQTIYSELVTYLRNGTVTQGRAAGQKFLSQYAITYGINLFVNYGHDLSKSRNIERAIMQSEEIGYGAVNAFGNFVYVPNVRMYFEDGDCCTYFDNQIVGHRWGAGNTGLPTRTSGDHIKCAFQ